jgi:pimeloyl-ACP methyl ester carboxylesterase
MRGDKVTVYSHRTAPTQFVEAKGIRFAYRRFGKQGSLPLVFNMHFTGTMDHWDPAITDGFARDREVILFNDAEVSSSSGEVPASVEEMAANTASFINAIGLARADVLGFSLGGIVAQQVAITEPKLVRRLVLVGTGLCGGDGAYENPDHVWPNAFFAPSKTSKATGHEYLKRSHLRTLDRDPELNEKVASAHLGALSRWDAPPRNPYEYLKQISQPTLVVNRSNDVLVDKSSFILQQNIPDAQLILYPDSNRGSPYQYSKLFVRHVSLFLSGQYMAA